VIYLDNNSTTAPLAEVVDVVSDVIRNNWGNPSSAHLVGRKARETLEAARHTVAEAFGAASPSGLIFTASGTESINLGFSCLLTDKIRQILVLSTDHSAVHRAANRWGGDRKVKLIPVNSEGEPDLDYLQKESAQVPSLVSVGLANNETGIIVDSRLISRICENNGAILHIDAVQAAGKIPMRVEDLNCAAVSLSAHKFHGSPGCGILFLQTRPDSGVFARIPNPGHQESGLRAGTENLAAIAGCGVAATLLPQSLRIMPYVETLRDRLESSLLEAIPGSEIHSKNSRRLPNTSNLYCPGRNASDLVLTLSRLGLAVSAGAACSNGGQASHVIQAMGFGEKRANSALRLSLGFNTTESEVTRAVELVKQAYEYTLPTHS
jgi:cysteine desulfurase